MVTPSSTIFLLFLSHIFSPISFRKSSSFIFFKFLTVSLLSKGIKRHSRIIISDLLAFVMVKDVSLKSED